MLDTGFVTLKESTRIKKMDSFCWIVDLASDNGMRIHPIYAFLLSLCTGEFDLDTVKSIYAGTFGRKKPDIAADVEKILIKVQKYIEWNDEPPVSSHQRYNPKDFLYDIKLSQMAAKGRFDTPGEMTLILTHACNFRCIYCFNSSAKAAGNQLTTGEWLDVIAQAKNLDILKCMLSGGEPMMHPGFFEILQKLLDLDILAYVCTNGSLIDNQALRKFRELKLPCIQISLDAACAATHDRLSAASGTFPKVVGAIKSLIESGIDVYIKSVITPVNVGEVGALIDLCYNLGVKQLILDRFDISLAGRGGADLFMTPEQEQVLAETAKRKQTEYAGKFSIMAVTGPRCWSGESDLIRCGALETSFIVLPQGDISVCEKLIDVPEMTAANVRDELLRQIWTSERITNIIRPSIAEMDEPCKSCEIVSRCNTGCFAQTLAIHHNPYGADPRCWKAGYANNPYQTIREAVYG
jgi:pyrroloquinoline quinone biosynthesis protein E